MAGYSLFFRKSVRKDLDAIPGKDLKRVIARIRALSANPRPPGAEKLSAQEQYRVRQGSYRIVYSIQDEERSVRVVKVGHRRDVYRR